MGGASRELRLASRASRLALIQSRMVAERLQAAGIRAEILPLSTRGDRDKHTPLYEIGGKGLFIREVEAALLDGRADLAVHSLKDMPVREHADLEIVACLPRACPFDRLVHPKGLSLEKLPPAARVGSSSLRRQLQLMQQRPDLHFVPLRGNVPTRLDKLATGELDAIVLAAAGLERLGLDVAGPLLDAGLCLPAGGQGIIAVQARREMAPELRSLLRTIDDAATATAAAAERLFLARLDASCHSPVAVWARQDGKNWRLDAWLADLSGNRSLRESVVTPEQQLLAAVLAVAERLLAAGGTEILAEQRRKYGVGL